MNQPRAMQYVNETVVAENVHVKCTGHDSVMALARYTSFLSPCEPSSALSPNYRKEGGRGHHVSLKPSASVAK